MSAEASPVAAKALGPGASETVLGVGGDRFGWGGEGPGWGGDDESVAGSVLGMRAAIGLSWYGPGCMYICVPGTRAKEKGRLIGDPAIGL